MVVFSQFPLTYRWNGWDNNQPKSTQTGYAGSVRECLTKSSQCGKYGIEKDTDDTSFRFYCNELCGGVTDGGDEDGTILSCPAGSLRQFGAVAVLSSDGNYREVCFGQAGDGS